MLCMCVCVCDALVLRTCVLLCDLAVLWLARLNVEEGERRCIQEIYTQAHMPRS